MNLEIKTDIPFAVPIFSVEFPGISDSLNLENIVEEFCIEREQNEPKQPWETRQTKGSLQKEVSSLAFIEILSTLTHWYMVSVQFPSEIINWYWVEEFTVAIGFGIDVLFNPVEGNQKYEIEGSLIGKTPIWTDSPLHTSNSCIYEEELERI